MYARFRALLWIDGPTKCFDLTPPCLLLWIDVLDYTFQKLLRTRSSFNKKMKLFLLALVGHILAPCLDDDDKTKCVGGYLF